MKTCWGPECKTANLADAIFCKKCGRRLGDRPDGPSVLAPPVRKAGIFSKTRAGIRYYAVADLVGDLIRLRDGGVDKDTALAMMAREAIGRDPVRRAEVLILVNFVFSPAAAKPATESDVIDAAFDLLGGSRRAGSGLAAALVVGSLFVLTWWLMARVPSDGGAIPPDSSPKAIPSAAATIDAGNISDFTSAEIDEGLLAICTNATLLKPPDPNLSDREVLRRSTVEICRRDAICGATAHRLLRRTISFFGGAHATRKKCEGLAKEAGITDGSDSTSSGRSR